MHRSNQPILVLMGATASGKSAFGVTLAQSFDAVILNADAMQCYHDLPLLTARPRESEMGGVPHQLYGIWDATTEGNAALWQAQVVPAIHAAHAAGKLPILLGGTGMYLKTLIEGISPVPAIDPALRERLRGEWEADPVACHVRFAALDPAMAARLEPGDSQRILRALEVIEQTGTSLAEWQSQPVEVPFASEQFIHTHIAIDRDVLYSRINQRFINMIDNGALDELRVLLARHPDLASPLMGACGVPELRAHLRGDMPLEAAISLAQQHSRNYAKRQLTWLRNQCPDSQAMAFEALQHPSELAQIIAHLAKTIDRPAVNH